MIRVTQYLYIILSVVGVIVSSIFFFHYPDLFPLRLYVIAIILFVLITGYNILFFWIINKALHGSNRNDFFTPMGRTYIKDNISIYFTEENAKKYLLIIKVGYIIIISGVIFILSLSSLLKSI